MFSEALPLSLTLIDLKLPKQKQDDVTEKWWSWLGRLKFNSVHIHEINTYLCHCVPAVLSWAWILHSLTLSLINEGKIMFTQVDSTYELILKLWV